MSQENGRSQGMKCPPGSHGEGAPAVTEIPPVASQRCIRIPCTAKRTGHQARCSLQPLLSDVNLSWPLPFKLPCYMRMTGAHQECIHHEAVTGTSLWH